MKEFNIGNIKVNPGLILAPMSGVTCHSFRELIKTLNPDSTGMLVTEFISIEALTRNNPKCFQMMRYSEKQRPISVQIFGYDLERISLAAKMAEDRGADIVDINCGCPAPKVVRKGGGCELMRQPLHLSKILEKVSAEISVPLTLKIRAGWDTDSKNALEIAKVAENSGIKMLAIHGRTKSEGYRGLADWSIVQAVAESLSIPVVGSGDVACTDSALKSSKTGVSGLMIGRAALLNPWIFSEVMAGFSGQTYEKPSYEATIDVLQLYQELLLDEMPEKGAIGKMKQLSSQITRRVPRSKEIRFKLTRSKNLEELKMHLEVWREELTSSTHSNISNDISSKDSSSIGALAA